jgi:glutaconyl-CoA decarboxylase
MKYEIKLNGKIYEVVVERGEAVVEREYEASAAPAPAPAPAVAPPPPPKPAVPAPAAPAPAPVPAGAEQVVSPLPGNVLEIRVEPGAQVKRGDGMFIVEAMKMENEVAAPCDGVVKQIVAGKGSVVATGDTLLVI